MVKKRITCSSGGVEEEEASESVLIKASRDNSVVHV